MSYLVFIYTLYMYLYIVTYSYMNLNATKRPFGHFDDSVGKQCKSRKIMLCAFLK